MSNKRLYIGKLPSDVTEKDLRREFEHFGAILSIRVLVKFAFIEYEDPRDARDAIERMNGISFMGERIIVQFQKGGQYSRNEDHQVMPHAFRSEENIDSDERFRSREPSLNERQIEAYNTPIQGQVSPRHKKFVKLWVRNNDSEDSFQPLGGFIAYTRSMTIESILKSKSVVVSNGFVLQAFDHNNSEEEILLDVPLHEIATAEYFEVDLVKVQQIVL